MAPLKVHGLELSTATSRVLGAIIEKDVQYELVLINMSARDHKSQAFLSINPFGQIPAVEDGDLKLFESRAITQYVSHQYQGSGTQLVSTDPKKMAAMLVWAEVEAHQFDPAASKLTYELVVKPMLGQATEPAVVEENEAKLGAVLDVYEARLAQTKYLAGDSFSLADLHHLPCLQYLVSTRVKKLIEERPHVGAWCADILARPAWAKVVELQNARKEKMQLKP